MHWGYKARKRGHPKSTKVVKGVTKNRKTECSLCTTDCTTLVDAITSHHEEDVESCSSIKTVLHETTPDEVEETKNRNSVLSAPLQATVNKDPQPAIMCFKVVKVVSLLWHLSSVMVAFSDNIVECHWYLTWLLCGVLACNCGSSSDDAGTVLW